MSLFSKSAKMLTKARTRASYELALTKFAEYCMSVNPDVQIIFCKPFWDGTALCIGAQNAAINLGFTYADLAQFNTNDNKATGLFEHAGVANHPGDKGMANIAEEIFKQLDVVLTRNIEIPNRLKLSSTANMFISMSCRKLSMTAR